MASSAMVPTTMAPPWKQFDYPRYSIGWRMGGGQDCYTAFYSWFSTASVEVRRAQALAFPEPLG